MYERITYKSKQIQIFSRTLELEFKDLWYCPLTLATIILSKFTTSITLASCMCLKWWTLGSFFWCFFYFAWLLHQSITLFTPLAIMWDWQHYVEFSSHSTWMWGIIHKILSVPHNTTMGLNNVMSLHEHVVILDILA